MADLLWFSSALVALRRRLGRKGLFALQAYVQRVQRGRGPGALAVAGWTALAAPLADDAARERDETTAEVHVTERVAGSDAFAYAFSGLTAGREYHARVTAYNRAGYGPVSAEVAAVPKTQASAPNKVSVAVGSGTSLIARWSPPSDDGGAKIQGYEVEWYSEPGTPEERDISAPSRHRPHRAPCSWAPCKAPSDKWCRILLPSTGSI